MSKLHDQVLGDNKEWNAMEARADTLPSDYRIVYGEMKSYLGRFAAGDGMKHRRHPQGRARALRDQRCPGQERPGRHWGGCRRVLRQPLRSTTSYLVKWRASLDRDVAKMLAE